MTGTASERPAFSCPRAGDWKLWAEGCPDACPECEGTGAVEAGPWWKPGMSDATVEEMHRRWIGFAGRVRADNHRLSRLLKGRMYRDTLRNQRRYSHPGNLSLVLPDDDAARDAVARIDLYGGAIGVEYVDPTELAERYRQGREE